MLISVKIDCQTPSVSVYFDSLSPEGAQAKINETLALIQSLADKLEAEFEPAAPRDHLGRPVKNGSVTK